MRIVSACRRFVSFSVIIIIIITCTNATQTCSVVCLVPETCCSPVLFVLLALLAARVVSICTLLVVPLAFIMLVAVVPVRHRTIVPVHLSFLLVPR